MRLLLSCWLCLAFFSLRAQTDTVSYLQPYDSLITYLHPMGEVMFTHTINGKQTLYSLGKFYGLTLQELYAYNPHVGANYKQGVQLRIPIPNRAIIKADPPPAMLPGLAVIYYRVRKGDTMYGLTRRTFLIDQASLEYRNPQLITEGLKPGQILHIGWMAVQPIPPDWREIKGGPYARLNHPYKLAYFRHAEGRRVRAEKGAATYPKDLADNSGWYCLHRTAPLKSYVEVYHPLTRQTMYLRVSARLPEGVYDRNTLVVVSPLAAKALGALDDRFYVTFKHY